MPDDPRDEPEAADNDDFREMLREFLSGDGDMDPAKLASAAGLPSDPALVARLIGQLQDALTNTTDGVNWDLALEQATTLAARGAVPSTTDERASFESALHVAALWLDEATDIAGLTQEPVLLNRSGWAESTMPVWTQLAEPVATSIADALTEVLDETLPDDATGMLGADPAKLLRNVGGTLFAMQLGQVVGQLAAEVVSGGDIGIPLSDGDQRQAVIVPQNVDAFGAGLDIPLDEVRIYLSVRELAHARLFRHAKWLRLQLISQITDFAHGIHVDTEQIENLATQFDPSNPDELRDAVTSGALIPPKSEEQLAALARLETQLALIEGWVDVVTASATTRLPKSGAIAETVRRRRASGGPAESAFATLVGLELRPRRLREAAAMWQKISDAVGADARDALWAHPDVLPTAEDIDDPTALIARLTATEPTEDDVDRAIADLLGDETGDRPREE
ncbi:MAG: hypothetical protein CMF56_01005 [Leifsonia sp.]|nr:hypothetical protein [Leifsonia sp.]|tara:strand:+ start:26127 stop:27482 length:1356 start_codon:yes stop_codon:yes gene_type:complete